MPFQSIGVENLDAVVNVRLTSEEKMRLAQDADLADISMSALVRARYFGRKVAASADMKMLAELRRIGGLLKHIHNESDGAYSQQTADTLKLIQRYIHSLNSKIK